MMNMFQIGELAVLPSLRGRVYLRLENAIVYRHLAPGSHLKEDELAKKFGVSRNPVREALQQLVHEGMADYVPAKGVFVHMPTEKEINDLLHVRSVLECEAIRLAATRRTTAHIDHMTLLIANGKEALARKNVTNLLEINGLFHDAVAEAADNAVLHQELKNLRKRVNWYYSGVVSAHASVDWDEHSDMLNAVREANEGLATKLMRRHLLRTQENIETELVAPH